MLCIVAKQPPNKHRSANFDSHGFYQTAKFNSCLLFSCCAVYPACFSTSLKLVSPSRLTHSTQQSTPLSAAWDHLCRVPRPAGEGPVPAPGRAGGSAATGPGAEVEGTRRLRSHRQAAGETHQVRARCTMLFVCSLFRPCAVMKSG